MYTHTHTHTHIHAHIGNGKLNRQLLSGVPAEPYAHWLPALRTSQGTNTCVHTRAHIYIQNNFCQESLQSRMHIGFPRMYTSVYAAVYMCMHI